MSLSIPLALAAAGIVATAVLALREARNLRASRSTILDAVTALFNDSQLAFDDAGFPSLTGDHQGRRIRLELIPDTMTIRRLPQLWLSITDICDLPIAGRGVAVLIRPSGADYYSLTERMSQRLDVPPGFPWETLIKGESAGSQVTLDRIRSTAARLFTDPRLKEIAVTARGVRMIRQLAEGKRGDHLLLRQSAFTSAQVTPRDVTELTAGINDLRAALTDNRDGKTYAS